MGISAIFMTAPAAAAAAVAATGIYFLDRHHTNKVVGDGVQASKIMNKMANLKPKLAPEFDGLNCFETVVVAH